MTDHTEIPADVMKAARLVADGWRRMDWNEYEGDLAADLAADIADAILAERERAAKVAKDAYLEFTDDAKLWLRDGMPKSSSNSTFMAVAAQTIFERIIKP